MQQKGCNLASAGINRRLNSVVLAFLAIFAPKREIEPKMRRSGTKLGGGAFYLLLTTATVCLDATCAWSLSVARSPMRTTFGRKSSIRMSIAERNANEMMANKPSRKTMLTKNIKQADPIPEAGIVEAVKIMRAGKLYRYNVPTAEESEVSICHLWSSEHL